MGRRRFLLGFGGASAAVAISGCATGLEQTSAEGRLSLLTYDDVEEAAALREQLTLFQEEKGVVPVLDTVSGSGAAEFPDKLRTRILGGQAPDIWRIWGGQIGEPFVEAGLTRALEEIYDQHGWTELLDESGIDGMTFQGALHGVPTHVASLGAWCNRQVFEEAGAPFPETYAELEEANELILESGVTPAGMGGMYGWHLMRLFEYLLEVTAGPDLHDALLTGDESWEHAAVVEAFDLFHAWEARGWITRGALGVTPDDAEQSIAQGASAYTISGQWMENTVVIASGQPHENFDTFLLPTDHTDNRHSGFVEGMMVSAHSGNLDEATELLDFIVQPEVQRALGNTQSVTHGAEPSEDDYPLSAQWVDIREDSGIYTIQDQAFPPAVSDGYYAVQSGVIQGDLSSQEAAREMQQIISEWQGAQ